jgi:hypothetical protein
MEDEEENSESAALPPARITLVELLLASLL